MDLGKPRAGVQERKTVTEVLGRCGWVDVLDACCCGFHEAEEQKEAEERVGRG